MEYCAERDQNRRPWVIEPGCGPIASIAGMWLRAQILVAGWPSPVIYLK
jgi:hypothetical protein